MACVAVNSLIRTLELEFLQSRPRSVVQKYHFISNNNDLIQSLHEKLRSLIKLFDENRTNSVGAVKGLETNLRDVAFRVEDEIEIQVADLYEDKVPLFLMFCQICDREIGKSHAFLKLRRTLERAVRDVDVIKDELSKIEMKYRKREIDEAIRRGVDYSKHVSQSKEKMVGRNDDFEIIKEMLIEHPSRQREVVSIEGMGGIGKTTLAKRVYEDPSVASHFDLRAWTVASQLHDKRQMLVGLLKSIFQRINAENDNDDALAEQLYQGLKGHRYLVVLDDVWSHEEWDAVRTCFTDDGNGSRVLLTTRIAEVANHIRSNNDFSHQMQLLDQGESWDLFCKKARVSSDDEFETIGRPIVAKCKGLPFAIVVVAGLLSKLDTLDEWKNIAESLCSFETTTIDEEYSRIVSLSYNHLPHNLKACFLYLGVFPEDYEINANELSRLWFAEGLVKSFDNESYEDVAKRYVQELKDRNLILVSELSCCGRNIKRFRMHDILHVFCIREAQNERLLHIVRDNISGFSFSLKRFRWLSLQSEHVVIPKYSHCRSIICFREMGDLNLKSFSLIRVLHHCSSKSYVNLVHLRYIRSGLSFDHSDSDASGSVFRPLTTWNLQTLHTDFDDESWNYFELPHLQYIRCDDFRSRFDPRYVIRNLHSISALKPGDCRRDFFEKIPCLKKLKIRGHVIGNPRTQRSLVRENKRVLVSVLENHDHFQQLESITLSNIILNKRRVCDKIFRLRNLKKLCLVDVDLYWTDINVFSKLPRLEVFKVDVPDSSYGEQEWELSEEDRFAELTFLEIRSFYLRYWKTSGDHFPKLERLVLSSCWKLEEIPIDFEDITNLKSIELDSCHPSAVVSAKQIQEEQHDQGNCDVVVIEKNTIKFGDSEDCESDEDEFG